MKLNSMQKKRLWLLKHGDTLRMMLSALRKFTRHTPINVIAVKREASEN